MQHATPPSQDLWLTAAECARRTGVTPRALRIYERQGLLKPQRTAKGWRLYGRAEIERLGEIAALKQLRLSLKQITALVAGRSADLPRILALQEAGLALERARAERGLALVTAAREALSRNSGLSIEDLIGLIKETHMHSDASTTRAWARYEQARPRTEIPFDAATRSRFEGAYQFDSGTLLTITPRPGGLAAQLTGGVPLDIFPESAEQFFYKAAPAQIAFGVEAATLHQDGFEFTASKIPPEAAAATEAAFANRVKQAIPHPQAKTCCAALSR